MIFRVQVLERYPGTDRKRNPTMLGRWRANGVSEMPAEIAPVRAKELRQQYGAARLASDDGSLIVTAMKLSTTVERR